DFSSVVFGTTQAEHLSRTGFAGGHIVCSGKRTSGCTRFQDIDHCVTYDLEVFGLKVNDMGRLDRLAFDLSGFGVANLADQVRLDVSAAISQHCRGLRQLEKRKWVVALPHGHRNRLARVPALLFRLAVILALPLGRGQNTATLTVQVDASKLAETKLLAEVVQGIDTHFRTKRIKIRIGRHDDSPMHVGRPIYGSGRIAEALPSQFKITGVRHPQGGRAYAEFKRGQCN